MKKKDLKKGFQKLFGISIIITIMFFILGLFMLLNPDSTLGFVSMLIGSCTLILGINSLIKYFKAGSIAVKSNLMFGVLLTVAGLILIFTDIVAQAIPLFLGVFGLINAIPKIQYALEMKKTGYDKWQNILYLALGAMLCSLFFIFNPFNGAYRVFGLVILIYALIDLFNFYILNKNIKYFKEDIKKVIQSDAIFGEGNIEKNLKEITGLDVNNSSPVSDNEQNKNTTIIETKEEDPENFVPYDD